jgi:hypothetical protein
VPCAERSADDSLLDVLDAGREVVDDEELFSGDRSATQSKREGKGSKKHARVVE